ncbi:hypothetical protein GCM10007425_21040 [Lysinibacillus alkalisoli]|uniref:Uncharacterized protein n=1 Tax=Lysinibacillus alkalisoli TaxID=1911548 RepID=A0A917G7C2_9BACI|nr:ABC transporter permease [Lysinibacillus alkalisoli]GGG26253.1 hypothetical protein GCM10007425_21040 [Lysinibacillus alkalisoli]
MGYFKLELTQFFTNKKNIALYVIMLCLAIYYAVTLAPQYDPIEQVNEKEIQARYDTRQHFIDTTEVTAFTHPTVRFALAVFTDWNALDKARLDALAQKDYHAYAQATGEWYTFSDELIYPANGEMFFYHPLYYTYGNLFAREDGRYGYLREASRYTAYAENNKALTLPILNEQTAWQTLQRSLQTFLPFIILGFSLLLSVDIVLKDRAYRTILRGFPVSEWYRLCMKGIVALIGSLLLLLPVGISFSIIAMQQGLGRLSLAVPIFEHSGRHFTTVPLGVAIGQSLLLVLLLIVMTILLVLLISIVFKNEFIILVIGALFMTLEFFYYEREIGPYRPVEWLPTSFIRVGDIVTGYRNFLYNTPGLQVTQGILVLSLCAVVLAILIKICSHNKRCHWM